MVLRPDKRQRGAVEDTGQAGSSRAPVYGVPDNGGARPALVVEGGDCFSPDAKPGLGYLAGWTVRYSVGIGSMSGKWAILTR